MSELQTRVEAAFERAFATPPDFTVRAPGRVNLIGEHTDYNDGFVLPCALGVETRIAVTPRGDGVVRVVAADVDGEQDEFVIDAAIAHHSGGGWHDYVRGMAAQLAAAGLGSGGADLAIAGDIPRGGGLSSSASLMVAVGLALASGDPIDRVRLALLAQVAENDFVGVRCGNMDQLASAASIDGAALLIDCRSLALTPVPIPEDVAIVVVDSGVARGLVEGHYNARRAACEAAATALGLASLRDALPGDLARLDGVVQRRARHVIGENARVLAAADALAADDLVAFGRLMGESHASMCDDFAITVPAVDRLSALAAAAIGGEGGARMTGGGFGGAVVAVMRAREVDRVVAAIRGGYRTPAGEPPRIMIERPAAGAGLVR